MSRSGLLSKFSVLILTAAIVCAVDRRLAAEEEPGFRSIFDGKTLESWDGNPQFWSVEDGAITGQTTPDNPTKGNTFLIWRGGEVADFELRLQFRIQGGNSGIQYRSREVENQKWVIAGYQADFDSDGNWTGTLYDERGRGVLARRGSKVVIGDDGRPSAAGETAPEPRILASIKKGDWNDYVIIAKGNHLVQKLNGIVTVDVTDNDAAKRKMSGLLALQLHAGPPMKVQFRNIRLRAVQRADNAAKRKKVAFMAGTRSHGYGAHEHFAGCTLLARSLQQGMPDVDVVVYRDGWPKDPHAFDDADAVVMYCDGGGGHPVNAHLQQIDQLAKKGVGIVCLHYGVEVPKGESGDRFLDWIGGYFETHWSVNPHWTARFRHLPEHPITRGVKPFEINDEWYYHMRFRPEMKGVTPILTDVPPPGTLTRPDGSRSGNPDVRAAVAKGEPQHVAWATERPDGGRGFGFTGGHVHWNWGNPDFRKLVLNAIVWASHAEVPAQGVTDRPLTLEDLEANQDFEQPANFNREAVRRQLNASAPQRSSKSESRDPADAVAGLDVADGLQATLFASEPTLLSLTNLDVDHRGRVWVCEVVNYRKNNGHRPEGDRILILEDRDGDGHADTTKVYYQGRDIDSAMGISVLGNKVIVSCSPNVFIFTDEDGDDKPDKQEVLFTKTGQAQHDHSAHSFIFGPDGKLYWNFGNTGQSVHDRDGNPVIDLAGNRVVDNGKPYYGGMAFRCNVDGSEFEVLGHNFRNNYEVAVDSFGTLWQSDNDDDGNKGVRINYVMEFGNYGYRDEMTGAGWQVERTGMEEEIPKRHWHLNDPGVVPNLLQTGAGSPTGITVYEGRLLPQRFWDQVIHCDAGPNVVRAYPVNNDGAGYKADVVNILHGARDSWFRPADVCVAPDGSLLVTDWYDPGVGGHNMQDLERGRLFRVAPPGHKYVVPKFDFSTPEGAVEALQNPNLAARYLAWTALHEMGRRAEPALESLFARGNPRHRARALWLLGKIEGRGEHYVRLAAGDPEPDIRIAAIRLARQLKIDVIPYIRKLVRDPAPQVRRELAIALRHNQSPAAPALWAELALQHDGKDRWYLEALGIGADKQWDAFFAAWLDAAGDNWSTPGGRDIVWRSRAPAACRYLAMIITDKEISPAEHPRYFRAFDFHTGPEKEKALNTILGLP